ncbi:Imm44 family immunity protein [Sediminibacterium sp.]|uniref:Imm44 family immunity protein n=1 Tax=Sediminibacterium sp. TaxID=1917865 RepID=UPI0025F36271|nr:Imm44 family immunity protein [Sediminibacterium sp.]MBT9484958.1 hypothetical protein [Sediminibacterium sp.]
MKYWSSGEVEFCVGDDFRRAMNLLEEKINLLLASKSYTNEIDQLEVIYVIVKGGGFERINFKPKSKILDLKVVIDYEKFFNSSPSVQIFILLQGLIKILENFAIKANLKYFDIFKFKEDLIKIL